MKNEKQKKLLIDILIKRYGTVILSREQTAKALGLSLSLLDKRRVKHLAPRYMKDGKSNSKVQYLISDIVDYLIESRVGEI